jgi:hypothetical protein
MLFGLRESDEIPRDAVRRRGGRDAEQKAIDR